MKKEKNPSLKPRIRNSGFHSLVKTVLDRFEVDSSIVVLISRYGYDPCLKTRLYEQTARKMIEKRGRNSLRSVTPTALIRH